MKAAYLNLRLDDDLKAQVVLFAKQDRRSFADEAAFFIEKGISSMVNQFSAGGTHETAAILTEARAEGGTK
jgi:hypothetical protein